MAEPLITAIVSTFRAERFIRGCLEDLVAQTLLDRMEILVIDSGSPEDERSICEEFARRYPQVRYLRTENEPLYAAWNRRRSPTEKLALPSRTNGPLDRW